MAELEDSILDTMKTALGVGVDNTEFDLEIIMAINSVFARLQQLDVGPEDAFEITDKTVKWADFLGTTKNINSVRTYMYLRVRLIWDIPATSYAIQAMEKQADYYEFNLQIARDGMPKS